MSPKRKKPEPEPLRVRLARPGYALTLDDVQLLLGGGLAAMDGIVAVAHAHARVDLSEEWAWRDLGQRHEAFGQRLIEIADAA